MPKSLSPCPLAARDFRRKTEAVVVLERTALLATSMKHEQPDVDLDLLWGNLDAVQQGRQEEARQRKARNTSMRKKLGDETDRTVRRGTQEQSTAVAIFS